MLDTSKVFRWHDSGDLGLAMPDHTNARLGAAAVLAGSAPSIGSDAVTDATIAVANILAYTVSVLGVADVQYLVDCAVDSLKEG